MQRHVDADCVPFRLALEVLSRPWCALILNGLQGGPFRFTEVRDRSRQPGDKVLSGRLKELEARGLVVRRVEPGPPVRVTYELTAGGRSFGEVAKAIERWGRGLKPVPRASRRASQGAARGGRTAGRRLARTAGSGSER
jgi:DNA-binding HxlR family transcriptional regulator